MKKILAIGIGSVAFVALGVAGGALFMPDDDLDSLLRPLPVIGSYAPQIVGMKSDFTNSISHLVDDTIYGVTSTWRGITNFSLTDRTQRVIIELEPVRTKKPRAPKPPEAPKVTQPEPAQQSTGTMAAQMKEPAHQAIAPSTAPTKSTMSVTKPPMPRAAETAPKPADNGALEPSTLPPASAPVPAEPKVPVVEKASGDKPSAEPSNQPEMTKKAEQEEVAAVMPNKNMAPKPKPERRPPSPAPKTDEGSVEHKKGLTYYKGIGGAAKNYKTAADWFRQSSAKGNAASQYNLGIMAYLGQGVDQNYGEAAKWFQQAANQDHALAQYNLGFLFYEGKGVEKDNLQAFMWIDRAARLGDEKAIKARDTLEKILPKDILKGQ